VYFVVTETQVEGTAIPEAVAIEGVVPEADVLGGATTGPEGPIAPECRAYTPGTHARKEEE
jgi:hypothetical protein